MDDPPEPSASVPAATATVPATGRRRRRRKRQQHLPLTHPRGPTAFSRQHNDVVDLIFNEVSGTRDPTADLRLITDTLRRSYAHVRVWTTTPTDAADALAARALAAGATLLVACGGDGTVTAVASAIQAHNAASTAQPSLPPPPPSSSPPSPSSSSSGKCAPVLAAVPRGTANAFCAALYVPSDVRAAAEMVCTGPTRRVDFARVSAGATNALESVTGASSTGAPSGSSSGSSAGAGGVNRMLLLCGVGLEAETVGRADRRLKRAIGAAAYAVAGLSSIWQQRAFTTDLVLHDVDDSLMFANGVAQARQLRLGRMRLHGVTVANAAPAASVLAQGIGEVRPDDGLLEVVCFAAVHPLGMIRTMFSMLGSALMRTRRARSNVYGLRARKVEIVCDPPQKVVIDGEDAGYTPITVELRGPEDAITVVAPKAGKVTRQRRRFSRFLGRLCRNVRGLVLFAAAVTLLNRSRNKRIAS